MVGLGGNNSQIFFKKILLYEMGLSYTWCNSKPMDLSKSNGQKKTLINANIPTSISLIVHCLLHSIRISKPNKRIHLTLSLSLRLVFKPLSLRLSPFAAPPPPLLQVATRTKKKNHINVLVL